MATTRELAGALFAADHGIALEEWIDERRDEGLSWRRIAQELAHFTEGRISVSHQTVLTWSLARKAAA